MTGSNGATLADLMRSKQGNVPLPPQLSEQVRRIAAAMSANSATPPVTEVFARRFLAGQIARRRVTTPAIEEFMKGAQGALGLSVDVGSLGLSVDVGKFGQSVDVGKLAGFQELMAPLVADMAERMTLLRELSIADLPEADVAVVDAELDASIERAKAMPEWQRDFIVKGPVPAGNLAFFLFELFCQFFPTWPVDACAGLAVTMAMSWWVASQALKP